MHSAKYMQETNLNVKLCQLLRLSVGWEVATPYGFVFLTAPIQGITTAWTVRVQPMFSQESRRPYTKLTARPPNVNVWLDAYIIFIVDWSLYIALHHIVKQT